jgi:hypothetical protein
MSAVYALLAGHNPLSLVERVPLFHLSRITHGRTVTVTPGSAFDAATASSIVSTRMAW